MKSSLVLGLCPLLAAPALADVLHPGLELGTLVAPVAGAPTLALQDGRLVVFDAGSVELHSAGGQLLATLGELAPGAELGAFRLSPDESFVLAGELDGGWLYRMPLNGSGAVPVGYLLGNTDAAFESDDEVLLSADTGADEGFTLWRLDLSAGSVGPVLSLPGGRGPVAVLSDGDALVAPAPAAGNTDLLRVDAADLVTLPAPVWEAQGNLVIAEIEAVEVTGDWVAETQYADYTGGSYYRWAGPDLFHTPGQGVLTYQVHVEQAGTYQLRIRNRHQHPDSTLENDCWVRMDGSPWIKVFSGGVVNAWNWGSTFDPEGAPQEPAHYELTPGVHTLEISGRSKNFMIDRFHLFLDGTPDPTLAWDPVSPIQAPGTEVTDLVAGGFDGIERLAVDPAYDTIVVSESDPGVGNQEIHLLGEALPEPLVLLDTDDEAYIDHLQLVPGTGVGLFHPFQSASGGRVVFQRVDASSGVAELMSLEPSRPQVSLTGPGTAGVGPVQMRLSGAWPQGWAMLALDSLAGASGGVSVHPVASGLPLVITPLDDASAFLVPFFLPVDANGELTLGFQNSLGLVGTTVFQFLVFDPSLELFGSSLPVLY